MSIKKHFIPLINVSPVDNGVFRDKYQKYGRVDEGEAPLRIFFGKTE